MSEVVRLQHPNGVDFDTARVINRQPLNRGGCEPKELVELALISADGTENLTTMISKRPNPQILSLTSPRLPIDPYANPAELYGMNWWTLVQKGLPTVPYLRIVSNTEVWMTNLSADGSEIYSSDTLQASFTGRESSPLDEDFIKIPIAEVFYRGRKLAGDSFIEGVGLPSDGAFALRVHPKKDWELLILDLTKAEFHPHPNVFLLQRNYDKAYAEATALDYLQKLMKE